ncbi:hypothetical protein ABZ297_05685 [Nonomuraea sp. NPDC005983]|uniref:DUF6924 domain-containing protein n=1 Tax=Nonomuraea sp. NPDC005983 TaxID=3155595 RepID=UPI0033B94FFB
MTVLPEACGLLVVRTGFSGQDAWQAVRAALGVTDEESFVEEFQDEVEVVNDPAYAGLTSDQLLALLPRGYTNPILVVVDSAALESAEMPVLVVDLVEERGRTFRVIPAELPSIQINLSIANMDFFEFADSADADGVFRGFGTS